MVVIDDIAQLKDLIANNHFNIFGNGYVYSRILNYIENNGWKTHLYSTITTESEWNRNGMTVGICGVNEDQKNIIVIIATNEKDHNEICDSLLQKGFTKIYAMSDHLSLEIEKNEQTSKKKQEELIRKRIIESIGKGLSKEKNCDFLLFSVPYWDVYSPFSAVPSLTAFLKDRGMNVKCLDLGIKSFYEALEDSWKEVAQMFMTRSFWNKRVIVNEENNYQSYEDYIDGLWFFRGEKFEISDVKEKYDSFNGIQRGILNEFYGLILMKDILPINFNVEWTIEDEIEKRNYLSLYKSFNKLLLEGFLPQEIKMIGISVTGTGQFMHGCVLAALLKKIYKGVPIVMGGSCADYFMNSLYFKKRDIFNYFDYVMVGEGETSLFSLYKCINERGDISEVTNLAFVDEDNSVTYTEQMLEDVTTLPVPDYSDLCLGEYLSAYLILPYQASRGCHYGYCAFCNHDEKYRHNYRMKPADKVVQDLLALIRKYNVWNFQFVDEAIRPDHFQEIIEVMEKHQEFNNTKWFYYSRVSFEYNEELLKRAKRVGCEMVMFGVETYNQRLLNFIKKGISVEATKYCLELFHRCGIKTYEWLMCNLPSETIEEMREDFNDVKKYWDNVDNIGMGMFMLENNTDMYKEPKSFNIINVDNNDPIRFQSTNGSEIIDKEKVIETFNMEIFPAIDRRYFDKDRYSLFFRNDKR